MRNAILLVYVSNNISLIDTEAEEKRRKLELIIFYYLIIVLILAKRILPTECATLVRWFWIAIAAQNFAGIVAVTCDAQRRVLGRPYGLQYGCALPWTKARKSWERHATLAGTST